MEQRKQKEAEFHNKIRNGLLKEDRPGYDRLTSNYKFYSITRKSQDFVNGWLKQRYENKTVLDYCCGDGGMAIFLARNGAKEAVGIDISEISIKNARKNALSQGVAKNTSFFVMDAEKLEFEKNFFDIIVCSGVLHHLDIQKVYPELARVLKPQGEIICVEPLAYNPIFQLYRKMTPHLRTEWEAKHILTKKEIELAKKYFGKVETKFFHLATLAVVPFRNLPVFNPLLGLSEMIDEGLLRVPILKWLAWQIVFTLSQPKK